MKAPQLRGFLFLDIAERYANFVVGQRTIVVLYFLRGWK